MLLGFLSEDRCSILIQSKFREDKGTSDNVFNLSNEELQMRQVEYLDIAMDELQDRNYYREDEDPKLYTKTPLGPLKKGWQDTAQPIICLYKLVTIKFHYFGLQTKVESFVFSYEKDIFIRFHKQLFCWQHDWMPLTMEEIAEKEDEYNRKSLEKYKANQKAED